MAVSFPNVSGFTGSYEGSMGTARGEPGGDRAVAEREDQYTGTNGATAEVTWNGFSLGRIPLDPEALRIELRRSYAGTDQEMMRELARREQQIKEVKKDGEHNKQRGVEDDAHRRRSFTLNESIAGASRSDPVKSEPAAPSDQPATLSSVKPGQGKGKKDDSEDLLDRALEMSQDFNQMGARFRV